MKHATVTLWGKYKYKVKMSEGMTMHDMAMAIALEVHKAEGKTKFTGVPRAYNYIYECLLRKSCLNFRVNTEDTKNNEAELLKAANELHNKSEYVKKECGCQWTDKVGEITRREYESGFQPDFCPKCNNHGFVYEHQDYRLGYTQSHTLIIDVDGKDPINLMKVKCFYESVLQCKFKVFETGNGYWLFADKKYKYIQSWVFDHCRILCPALELCCFEEYKKKLLALDEGDKGQFKRATPEIIKASRLYRVPDDIYFDVAFTFLSIKRERSTIRITKKHKDDKVTLLNI